MIKEFTYISSKGKSHRRLFVLKEDDAHLSGIDLDLILEEDANFIIEYYKDYPIPEDNSPIEWFKPEWKSAHRKFFKHKMSDIS